MIHGSCNLLNSYVPEAPHLFRARFDLYSGIPMVDMVPDHRYCSKTRFLGHWARQVKFVAECGPHTSLVQSRANDSLVEDCS